MINGELLIGGKNRKGSNGEFFGIQAETGAQLQPVFAGATHADLDEACALAHVAFDLYRSSSLEARASFLKTIAENILDLGEELIDRCVAESGLPRGRIEGERGRTVGQLRLFASVLREGRFLDVRIDKALPERQPLPRPDIRLRNIGIGPVAVFGASNFPLAFSVAGGDTASALAAGCPVIVKAHSAHPGTSELVGRAVQAAVKQHDLPAGTFALLFDSCRAISQCLVADARIKAVGFTGSRTAGVAFMQIAASRAEPIPVYAEMSSINPILLFPHALAIRGSEIGKQLIPALTLGAGQFCTNPGLVLAIDGEGYQQFLDSAALTLTQSPAATMLTPGIHKSYCSGVDHLASHPDVKTIARGLVGQQYQGQATLFEASSEAFLTKKELQEEIFGASTLVVRCKSQEDFRKVAQHLEGQLTIAMHIDQADHQLAREFVPLLEKKAGRLIVNGFGTGVEVCHAMVHGGPFPATSDTRTTSVGALAINRFLRPVSYQSFPADLLSQDVSDENPWSVPQRVDPKA